MFKTSTCHKTKLPVCNHKYSSAQRANINEENLQAVVESVQGMFWSIETDIGSKVFGIKKISMEKKG